VQPSTRYLRLAMRPGCRGAAVRAVGGDHQIGRERAAVRHGQLAAGVTETASS